MGRLASIVVLLLAVACGGGKAEAPPPGCPGSQQRCGSDCFDLQTTAAHCGACGTACGVTQVCAAATCGCPGGTTACGDVCADLQSSDAHCGACGAPCPLGAACSGGSCLAVCTAPEVACGLTCRNLASAADACGRCGRACTAGASCVGGACTPSACAGLLDLPGAPLHARWYTVLAAADLDGDHRRDLVGAWNRTITVERSLGGGRFAVAQTLLLPVGAQAGALVLADLDLDAYLDLAVADRTGWVHVAKGTVGGTFGSFTSVAAGVGADGIAAADVDRNGDLDLVVSAEGPFTQGTAAVLWNDGAGAFPSQLPLAPTGRPSDVAVASVNGDLYPDVLVAEYAAGKVSVFLSLGGVAFDAEQVVTVGGGTQTLALADLDGDGHLDLITSSAGDTRVALGNGDGTFRDAATYAAGSNGLVIADVDGDGDLDVALASGEVLLGAGDGTFTVSSIGMLTSSSSGIVAADLDGDGAVDLAFGDGLVALHAAAGGWLVPASVADGELVAVGDLDGDLDPDVVVRETPGVGSPGLVALLGRGDGTFTPVAGAAEAMSSMLHPAALADLDGDGRLDLVAYDGVSIATWFGDGSGALVPGPTFVTTTVAELVATDLDGDGHADLIGREAATLADEGGPVWVRLAGPSRTFGAPVEVIGGATALAVADLDGNGAPDLLVGHRSGLSVRIFLGAGDGSFVFQSEKVLGNLVTGIAAGDLDGDGVIDLVVTAGQTSDRPASFAATMAGLGGGALGVPVRVASLDGAGPGSPVLADLDGDGAAELLVTPEATAQLSLLRNLGNGTFVPPQQEPIFSPRTVAVGDLDRDGRPDVVVDGPGVRGVRLLRTGCRP